MSSEGLLLSTLLNGFFEAGWSIQILLGDADRAQYEASRLARPKIEQHLRTMADVARDLPPEVRERMPKIDWDSWVELGEHLPPVSEHDRALVWAAIDKWLPPAGAAMRGYRRQMPELWQFKL